MTNISKTMVRGAFALIAATAASHMLAQPSEAQMMGRGMMGDCPMMAEHGGMGMMDRANPMAIAEGRLAYIKAELGITEAQAEAWKAYEDAARAHRHASHQAMLGAKQSESAVDQLDQQAAVMEARIKAIQKLKPATAKLYEVLSAEQRQKANRLLRIE